MFQLLGASFIASYIKSLTPAQIQSYVKNLSPDMIKTVIPMLTPEAIKVVAEALTPDVLKSVASALTGETLKVIANSLTPEVVATIAQNVKPELVKTLLSSLSQESLNEVSKILTPEFMKSFTTGLSVESAAAVSSLVQYVTGVDIASFASSKVGVNINLEDGKVLSISGASLGTFAQEINKLTGSNFADVLTGDDNAEAILAGSGNDTLGGSEGADTLNGGAGADVVTYGNSDFAVTVNLTTNKATGGDAEGDTFFQIENVTGSGHNDFLVGNTFANAINGGAGADVLNGGAGADTLNGGEGVDSVSYTTATSGVNANLQLGYGLSGEATGDRYSNIENVLGSSFGDNLVGNAGSNMIYGDKGNDTLVGGDGADILAGGEGSDLASYATSASGVYVDLQNGYASDGDRLVEIERVTGSAKNDQIIGNDANNTLDGALGNDTLDGGAGNNLLVGGAGDDVFITNLNSAGADTVFDFKAGSANGDKLVFADHFDFNTTNAMTFADAMGFASQVGRDTVFKFEDKSVTLKNVLKTAINEGDIEFVTHDISAVLSDADLLV